MQELSVRELQTADIELIIKYWLDSPPAFLISMGVDLKKLPSMEEFNLMLSGQLKESYEEKKSYCIIWLRNNEPIGHSNVNKINYRKDAYMHLHLWNSENRMKGLGLELVKMTLPCFFNNLCLQTVYCEPYALNPAPNRILRKLGFKFIKEHVTIPGAINFEQPVNLYALNKEELTFISS